MPIREFKTSIYLRAWLEGWGRLGQRMHWAWNPTCIKCLKRHLLSLLLEAPCAGARKGKELQNAQHPQAQTSLQRGVVLHSSAPTTVMWSPGHVHGPWDTASVSCLGIWNWWRWSAAQLNLNENWNDSSDLRSMGQGVPWLRRYKRSACQGKCRWSLCTWPKHTVPKAVVFMVPTEPTYTSGEKQDLDWHKHIFNLHCQCTLLCNNGNKTTIANTDGVLGLCHHSLHLTNTYWLILVTNLISEDCFGVFSPFYKTSKQAQRG